MRRLVYDELSADGTVHVSLAWQLLEGRLAGIALVDADLRGAQRLYSTQLQRRTNAVQKL